MVLASACEDVLLIKKSCSNHYSDRVLKIVQFFKNNTKIKLRFSDRYNELLLFRISFD